MVTKRICTRTLQALINIQESELKDMHIIYFKNHELKKFGTMTMYDLKHDKLIIEDLKTKENYEFLNPRAVVHAGWMVD
jgi:hypothetical protein